MDGQISCSEVVGLDSRDDGIAWLDVNLRSWKNFEIFSTGNHIRLALEGRNKTEAISGNPEGAQVEQVEDLKHLD